MNTETRIKQIVATSMCKSPNDITLATRFEDDLGCDSLDMVEMGMEVEDAFELTIPDDHLNTFTTVADLVNYVGTMEAARARAVT